MDLTLTNMDASILRKKILSFADEEQARVLQRFFKTGPGEYGEGDRFLGVRVPLIRRVVKDAFRDNPSFTETELVKLFDDPYHEIRFAGLLYLTLKYERILKQGLPGGDELIQFYLTHAEKGNNWDLVDTICPGLLGKWLCLEDVSDEEKFDVMDSLAESDNLWLQRISMVATWRTLREKRADFTLRYAERNLHHSHDLMHKAVGWMLREMGKRVDVRLLRTFLENHATEMPRTTLRYAIEKLEESERRYWLAQKSR